MTHQGLCAAATLSGAGWRAWLWLQAPAPTRVRISLGWASSNLYSKKVLKSGESSTCKCNSLTCPTSTCGLCAPPISFAEWPTCPTEISWGLQGHWNATLWLKISFSDSNLIYKVLCPCSFIWPQLITLCGLVFFIGMSDHKLWVVKFLHFCKASHSQF